MRHLTLALLLASPALPAATFTVDTTSDASLTACTVAAGDCSLRGAISNANGISDADIVAFDIPAASDAGCVAATGVCRITLGADLPVIGAASPGFELTIDGYSQPGALPNTTVAPAGLDSVLKIELRPSAPDTPASALVLRSQTTVRGLAIGGFLTGIGFNPGSPCNVGSTGLHGNYINTDAAGTSPVARDNGTGIRASLGSCTGEVRVGSAVPADRNLLVAATSGGRAILYNLASGSVEGNLIGSDRSGTVALGTVTGIQVFGLFSAQQVTIGGATPAHGNVFVGANNIGLDLGAGCTAVAPCVIVENNRIGVGSTGNALGNSSAVILGGSGGIRFGGPGRANRIENNKRGVTISSGTGHDIAENRFANNFGDLSGSDFGLGISLGGITHRVNDVGDADGGSNRGQNFPEISAFAVNGGNVELSYRVDTATGNATYPLRVDFYKAAGDEGQDFLGSDAYLAGEAQTVKTISLPIPDGIGPDGIGVTPDDVIVATATDAEGNSSEFSFHPATLAITDDGPDPSPAGTPYQVDVQADATAGPFHPNGVVRITDVRGGVCEATLAAAPEPLRSTGSCLLVPGGGAGGITVTAIYHTLRSAFGAPNGTSLQAATSHVLTAPPPEQVSFARCVEAVPEDAGTASVRVNRQGVGDVSVAFEHEPGSATAGIDYTAPVSGVLSWTGTDMTPRLIAVPILADAIREAVPETFRLRLFDPLDTSITPIGLSEVRIYDDEEGHLFFDGFDGPGCPQ